MSIRRDSQGSKDRWWNVGCRTLDELSPRTLQALCRQGDRYTAWPDQTLLAAGSVVDWVFLVLEGELVLRRSGRDLRVLRAGSIYGALESLDVTHAPADLVARDVTRVLVLASRAYRALAQTHPDFSYWVLRALALQGQDAA